MELDNSRKSEIYMNAHCFIILICMSDIFTFEILSSNLPVAKSALDAAKIHYALVNYSQLHAIGLGYNAAHPALIQVAAKDKEKAAELLEGL